MVENALARFLVLGLGARELWFLPASILHLSDY